MTPNQTLLRSLPLITLLLPLASAEAALVARPGGLVYDSDQNITWLADANYAETLFADSGGSAGADFGEFDWAGANAWADALVYADASDWRLPTADPACATDECPDAEMGSLFYTSLGGTYGTPITDSHNAAFGLFSNLDSRLYWTADADASDPSFAWTLDFFDGSQLAYANDIQALAWAVHDGDIGAVPAPATAALLALGLLGLRRRRDRDAA